MKYIFCFFLLSTFFISGLSAQQDHFLYFQTEAKQAFYIKLADKVFNSSPTGYLILPKLKEGSYKLTLGFPKNEWPEGVVNYSLDRDAGFLVRNFTEKGWGLFDLQSLKIIMPGERSIVTKPARTEDVKNDSFSDMLATVVNDSTLKEKDITITESNSKATGQMDPSPAELTAGDTKDIPLATAVFNKTDTERQVLYSLITKKSQVKRKGTIEMIYIDNYNKEADTIRVSMSFQKNKEKVDNSEAQSLKISDRPDSNLKKEQMVVLDTLISKQNADTSALFKPDVDSMQGQVNTTQIPVKVEKNTAEMIADTTSLPNQDKVEFLPAKTGMINSNCRQYATEDDFLKLRKKMAAEKTDDNMITAAKKIFKAKCFTTKDIKNLSALFLNDREKYNFFDAAYPYVSDSDMFSTLGSQLTDPYYQKRFEAMIQH